MIKKYRPNVTRIVNKLFSLLLLGLGITVMTIDGDATFLVFISIIAIGLFFSKEKTVW